MSKELGNINGKINVISYWGGDAHGVCLQITGENGYVQLTASEMVVLIPMLQRTITQELERKKLICGKAINANEDLVRTIVKDMHDVAELAIAQPIFDVAAMLVLGAANVTVAEG